MTEPLDVLAVMAHPDDVELLCGGALIRSSVLGERTGALDLSRGERGTRGSVEIREREASRAAEILGLSVRRNAGLPDAGVRNTDDARRAVVERIRELRPRVVVTHWPEGRHPDHRATARLVYDACFLSGLTNFDAPGEAHRPFKVVHAAAFRDDVSTPTFVVDVTEQHDRKLEALACYESQFEGLRQAGEVFPGGGRPLFEQISARMAADGARIRVRYGEPFWTRETLSVASLGSLPVSTF
ncbi:MAG: bacillithiol biosynthesis deacetylase BshB1 [Gemmatimonadota bacterium]